MQLQLEDAVREYRRQKNVFHDKQLSDFYLNYIKGKAKTLFDNYDLQMDDKASYLIEGCCLNYDLYCGIPFLDYVIRVIELNYDILGMGKKSEQDFYEAQMFHGNGFHTFRNTLTSNPERLSMERVQAAINRKHRQERKTAKARMAALQAGLTMEEPTEEEQG